MNIEILFHVPLDSTEVYEVLSGLQKAIYRHVNPLKLLPLLKRQGVLTQEEFEVINQTNITGHQQISYIIDAITSKGKSAMDRFIAALKEGTDHLPHQALAEILEGVRNSSFTPLSPGFSMIEDVVSPHLEAFIHCVDPHVLLQNLMKCQLITGDEVDYLSNLNLTTARLNCRIFVKLYFCCRPDVVEKFIYCLIAESTHPSHRDLAWRLIQQLSSLEQHRELANRMEQAFRDTPWVSCIYHHSYNYAG